MEGLWEQCRFHPRFSTEEVLRILDALQFHEKSVKDGNPMVCPAMWKKGAKAMKPTTEGVAEYFKGK